MWTHRVEGNDTVMSWSEAGAFLIPMSLLLMIIGAWLFDAMMQLRWMHQRELAMALGVAMRGLLEASGV